MHNVGLSRSPNLLAGFERPRRGSGKRVEKEMQERDGEIKKKHPFAE